MQTQPQDSATIYDESVFKILMDYEIGRCQRYASPISLLRIGLLPGRNPSENTKPPADILPIMLNARLRKADIPARIGNEFVALLPVTDEANARIVCNRLLRVTHGTFTVPLGFSTPISICIGLSSHLGGEGLNGEKLMQEAERALREARAHGAQSFAAYSDIAKTEPRNLPSN